MNKKFLSLFSLLGIVLTSCAHHVVIGSGKQATEDRKVSGFENLDISTSLHAIINVQPGAQTSLTLSGYQNILDDIKTEVKDNTLRIYTEDDIQFGINKKIEAVITVPSLAALSLSGAPDADIHGTINCKNFKLDISGAANANIENLSSTELSSDLSGAGKIEITGGNVQHAQYSISGAGSIRAYGLQTKETVASVSGAGECDVTAQEKLEAHISGVGKVRYKGHPQVDSHVSGVGSVSDAN